MEGGQRTEIPASIHDLIQTCVVSATKTLKILVSLNEHNVLGTFANLTPETDNVAGLPKYILECEV